MSYQRDVSSRKFLRYRAPRLVFAAGLAAALLAGCGRDADEQALTDASITLASLDVGVGTRTPPGVSSKAYRDVITAMQPLASGDGSVAADAAVLLSNAQRGLGIHEATEAAALEKSAVNMMPGIRARLRAWQMHNAAAQAAEAYDPAPELERIDTDVRARQEQAERERATKTEIEARVADLLQQVADRLAKAAALRDEAGSLQLQIPAVSATEGLALAEQVRELSRQADKLEFEARDLKNQADRLALDVQSSQLEIDKLTEQIRLMGQSRAAVQARATASEEHAARARADAQQAAGEIAERIDTGESALTPFREQQVNAATAEAVRQFQTAGSSARSGVGARRSNAQLAIGQAQQSLGDAHWTSALGHDAYALLLEELAASDPALPSAAEYASRAEAARTAANEARTAAYEAYQGAKQAYESTGASGEASELLDEVSARLNEVSRAVGKGVISEETLNSLTDPEPAAEEEPAIDEPAADEGEPVAADAVEEIRSLVQAANDAIGEGRYSAIGDMMHPATDAEAPLVGGMGDTLDAFESLENATTEAFGESFFTWVASNPAQGASAQMMNPAESFSFDAASLDITVDGDEAVALTGDPASPEIKFRRIDGQWKMLFSLENLGAAGEMPDQARQVVVELLPEILSATSAAYTEAASEVESGELQSNQAVLVAITTKLQPLNMRILQKMSEAGAGGG